MIDRSNFAWNLLFTVLAVLLGLWGVSQVGMDTQVPIHFDVKGNANRWAAAKWGLFIVPLLLIANVALQIALPRLDPRGGNLQRSSKAYGVIWVSIQAFLLAIQCMLVTKTLGYPIEISGFIPGLVGALFVAMGNIMGKLRWNFTVGIRTPWTLADERVWDKTHRFGGRLFVVGGLLLILGGCLPLAAQVRTWMVPGVTVLVSLISVLKSYLLWKESVSHHSM